MAPTSLRVHVSKEHSGEGDKTKRITRLYVVIPSALISALVSIATLSIWNNHIDLSDPQTRESIRNIARPEPWTKSEQDRYADGLEKDLGELERRLAALEAKKVPPTP